MRKYFFLIAFLYFLGLLTIFNLGLGINAVVYSLGYIFIVINILVYSHVKQNRYYYRALWNEQKKINEKKVRDWVESDD